MHLRSKQTIWFQERLFWAKYNFEQTKNGTPLGTGEFEHWFRRSQSKGILISTKETKISYKSKYQRAVSERKKQTKIGYKSKYQSAVFERDNDDSFRYTCRIKNMFGNTDEERKRTYTVDSNANRFGKKKNVIIGGREEVPREREREG